MHRKQITNATTVLIGDCLEGLRSLPADSVHCCVTSPPYWGLRSYLPADHPAKALELGSERTRVTRPRPNDYAKRTGEEGTGNACSNSVAGVSVVTTGWQPTCTCQMVGHPPTPCIVLDPFGGSGTTAGVAEAHGRRAILCELSPDYVELMPDRIAMVIESLRKPKKAKRSRQVKSSAKSQINLFM